MLNIRFNPVRVASSFVPQLFLGGPPEIGVWSKCSCNDTCRDCQNWTDHRHKVRGQRVKSYPISDARAYSALYGLFHLILGLDVYKSISSRDIPTSIQAYIGRYTDAQRVIHADRHRDGLTAVTLTMKSRNK